MSVDLEQVRLKLPLPALMERIGLGAHVKKSARCPFHEDKTNSFSVYNAGGRWWWKCFAGCGSGDEVELLQVAHGLNLGDAIKEYADLAGGGSATVADACRIFEGKVTKIAPPESEPEIEPAKLTRLGSKGVKQLARWRGYSQEFCQWLADKGLIGLHEDRFIAFPVENGLHYRLKDGSWRYTPGSKITLFVLGQIEEGAHIHCFESQWDALAFADLTGNRDNIVATRGSNNFAPLVSRLSGHTGTIYLWPQHDREHTPENRWPKVQGVPTPASEIWLREIRNALPFEQVMKVTTSSLYKDLNDWVREGGANGDEVSRCYLDAEVFPVVGVTNEHANEQPATDDREEAEGDTEPSGGDTISKDNLPAEPVLAEPSCAHESCEGGEARESTNQCVPGCNTEGPDSCDGGQDSLPTQERDTNDERRPNSSLGATLDKIASFLRKYVIFPMPEQADAIALWVAHAWAFEAFRFTPYLHVCSPEKRCGKTRLLECIKLLVPRPRDFVRPSEPVLFRTIQKEKPTLLLDEIDTIFGKDADSSAEGLRGVLNAGFQAGATIPRCEGKTHKVVEFAVFCPKVIAGIGKVPDTVRDRSLEIKLVRQTRKEQAARFRLTLAEQEACSLRVALEKWSKDALASLRSSVPYLPEQLSDRQMDMTEPLLAIAESAGEDWAERGREAIIALCSQAEDQSPGVQLLKSIREIFSAKDREAIETGELLHALISIQEASAPWVGWWENDIKRQNMHGPAHKLARMLEPYGIRPVELDDDAMGEAKGYRRADFEDAWQRYLSPVKGMVTMELGF